MLNVINILPILKEHFRTLKEDTSLVGIIFIFIAFPLLLATGLLLLEIALTKEILNTLITSFTIFVGFTINVLVIFLLKNKDEKIRIRKKLVEHLIYNSLYELVLGLVILFLAVIILALIPKITIGFLVLSLILYSLVFNFIFTLLMISKRFFVIFYCKLTDMEGDKHESQS